MRCVNLQGTAIVQITTQTNNNEYTDHVHDPTY